MCPLPAMCWISCANPGGFEKIHPPVLERIQVGKREQNGWRGQHKVLLSPEPFQDLPVLEAACGTGLTGFGYWGQARTRTAGRRHWCQELLLGVPLEYQL